MGMAGEEEQTQWPSGREEKIFVSVRLRPLNEKEIARKDVSDWECINDNTIIYRNNLSISERSMYATGYTFDRVFSSDCSTRQVYQEGAKEVALSVVSGIHASVFAYGQTSSGKTYTMTGITDYSLADIYDYIERHKEREFILKFSAMEIYNESVRDLLSADSTPLRLLDDPEKGTVVEKLTEETLRDWNHFKELLSVCEAQRQIGETALNEASSRSHQILRLTIESSAREFAGNEKLSTLSATVNFVDLAGSERASQSLSAGTRLKEGCHINRSLLTLGTVIRKLSKGRNGHIPFRDSKLTRILQSSLGGNARTSIICTMSPARTHVEQSRNTLLFASCAKEVITNAQVNVVMSDKALVKHLQRELARLESELRSQGPTCITSDSAALLREKDLEIEKLKREIMDLTVQLDLAWSQVEDLGRVDGDDKPSTKWVSLDHQYPKLRVRNSWDSELSILKNPISADPHCQGIGVRSSNASPHSGEHSRSSSDENLFQLPDFKVNFLHTGCSQQLAITVPGFIETEEIEEQPDEYLEDHCKEVRCIETEESSKNIHADSNMPESSLNRSEDLSMSLSEANTVNSVLTEVENEHRGKQEFRANSLPLKEEKEPNRTLPDFVIPSPEKSSSWLSEENISTSRSLRLIRSRSCKASLMSSSSPLLLEKEEKNECTPPNWFEKNFTGRPEGIQKKLSMLKYGCDDERLSINGLHTFTSNAAVCEHKAQNVKTSNDVGGLKEMTKLQYEMPLAEHAVKETEQKSVVSAKNVKDVGLDPIQDCFTVPSMWPLEFKRLQREIIELWHACNVSLAHRTYFFLLFKGDPNDSIYMEVELRRLSFIKDTFSRGRKTVEDGRTLTRTSSLRALGRERNRLSQQMKKRFSKEDRENLFLRWGIGLNTKQRRLQLAHCLWSDTKDMEHISESAAVVAMVVGFVDSGMGTKEMFGLNFAPRRTTKKSNRWKRSVLSLSIL